MKLATHPALHPSRETLESFMRGELPRAQAVAVVRHLLRGCPQCLQVTGGLWSLGEQPRPDQYLLEEMRRLVRAFLEGWISFEGEESL